MEIDVKEYFNNDRYFGDDTKGKIGFGIYIWNNGDRYIGQMFNRRMDGKGILLKTNEKKVIKGDFKNGKLNGYATKFEDNKIFFEGYFKDDLSHGKGKKIFDNGDTYEGEYENGKKNGFGIYKWVNGDTYYGMWKNDKIEGYGIKYLRDTSSYEGEWMDFQAHGKGKKIFFGGDIHEGEYAFDKRDGFGIYKFKNGDKFEGYWKDGINVNGSYYYNNGRIFKGSFINGEKKEGVFSNPITKRTFKQTWCEIEKKLIDEEEIDYFSTIEMKTISPYERIDKLTQENNRLKEIVKHLYENKEHSNKKCQICMVNDLNCLLFKCGHLCCCVECVKRIDKCPICRNEIKDYLEIFLC